MIESRPVTFVISAGAYPSGGVCEAIEALRQYLIEAFRAVDIVRNECMLFAEFPFKVVSVGAKGFVTASGFRDEVMIMLTVIDPAYPFTDQAKMLEDLRRIVRDVLLKAVTEAGIAEEKEVFIVDARYLDYPLRLVDAYHIGVKRPVTDFIPPTQGWGTY